MTTRVVQQRKIEKQTLGNIVATTPPIAGDRLLTTKEVAEIIGSKPGTLHRARLTGANMPPWIKIGSSVRYKYSTLCRWIQAQEEYTSTSEVNNGKHA